MIPFLYSFIPQTPHKQRISPPQTYQFGELQSLEQVRPPCINVQLPFVYSELTSTYLLFFLTGAQLGPNFSPKNITKNDTEKNYGNSTGQ